MGVSGTDVVSVSRVLDLCRPFGFIAPKTLNYLTFQSFDFEPASDKAYQLLVHGRWFSPGIPASSTTKTGRHDIAESGVKHQ
jgi:hypothetical protein